MQMDYDTILDILGNDTRRKILSILSQEPMYFNQLAKEIDIGQQAILRHLQVLEDNGLIETYREKSDFGAPSRKYYRLTTSFILTVSLSEDDFTITKKNIVESRNKDSKKYYKAFDAIPKDAIKALFPLQETLDNIEEEISSLESRLNDLLALRQLVLRRIHEIGTQSFEEDERKVLYKIIQESPSTFAELSEMLDEKESSLKSMIDSMRNKMDRISGKTLFDLQ